MSSFCPAGFLRLPNICDNYRNIAMIKHKTNTIHHDATPLEHPLIKNVQGVPMTVNDAL